MAVVGGTAIRRRFFFGIAPPRSYIIGPSRLPPWRISTNRWKSPGPTLTDGTSGFLQGVSLGGLGMVGTVETLTLVGKRAQARLPYGVAPHTGVKFFDKLEQYR